MWGSIHCTRKPWCQVAWFHPLLGLRTHHTCMAGTRPKDLPVGASHLSSRPGHHCPYNGPSSAFQSHVSLICPQISPQDCPLSIPTPGYPLPIYVLLNTLSCTERAESSLHGQHGLQDQPRKRDKISLVGFFSPDPACSLPWDQL